jgi:acetyltransferase-like isoleucine patch superfamily enzyme
MFNKHPKLLKFLLKIRNNFFPSFLQNWIKYIVVKWKIKFSIVKNINLTEISNSDIQIDKSVGIGKNSFIDGKIFIDKHTGLWHNLHLHWGKIYTTTIWSYCSISWNVSILWNKTHDYTKLTTYYIKENLSKQEIEDLEGEWPITIWHDVWIWCNVVILSNTKIGIWAVIGSGSIVTKDIPPYAIAVWNPAKVIKYRFNEETIQKLLKSEWWNWDKEKIKENYHLEFLNKV